MADKRIKKIRDGVYRIRISLPPDPITGKRRQPSKTCIGTQEEAAKVLYTMLLEEGSKSVASSGMTVDQLFESWISSPTSKGQVRQPISSYNERQRYALHVEPYLGRRRVNTIERRDIADLYDRLVSRSGLSPTSVRRVHQLCSAMFTWAIDREIVDRNPCSRIARIPRTVNSMPIAPTFEQVSEVIEVLRQSDPELWLFIRVTATIATRRGELSALTWGNIDLENEIVSVCKSVTWVPGMGTCFNNTKTGQAGFGELGLDPQLAAELRQRFLVHQSIADMCGDDVKTYFLFPSTHSMTEPRRGDTFTARLRKFFAKNPHLEKLTIRELRRFVSSETRERGSDSTTAQAVLRHTSPVTTARYYRSPRRSKVLESTRQIGRELSSVAI
jgi:integrase